MNTENVEYLQKNLFNLGFGEKLHEELKNKIQQNLPQFALKAEAAFSKENLEATLHFKRSENGDKYFFNKFDASLKSEFHAERTHTFYLNQGSGVTFKEAFNLLSGNAVHKHLLTKEGEKYNAWLKLDLTQKDDNNNFKVEKYHQNYGYDLKKVLAEFPIKELSNADAKEMLIKSLEKGNRQFVTIEQNGSEEKFFIRANPKDRTVDVFDKQLKPVQAETLKRSAKQDQQKSVSTEVGLNGKELTNDVAKKDLAKTDKPQNVQKSKSRRMSH